MPIRYEIIGTVTRRDQQLIDSAIEETEILLEEVVEFCNPKGLFIRGGHTDIEKAAVKTWFGSYKDGRKAAWRVYSAIYENTETITIKPYFDRRNSLDPQFQEVDIDEVHAFTSTEDNQRIITLCPKFYTASLISRASTLLHELTHYFGETEDFDLNATTAEEEAKELALTQPDDAQKCAYNFEFFALHLPEKKLSRFEETREQLEGELKRGQNNENKRMTRTQFNKLGIR